MLKALDRVEYNPAREKLYVYLLAAVQFSHIVDFVVMMPLGPTFMKEFNISPQEFGGIVAAYNFSAAIFGLLNSIIADKFDRKKALIVCFLGFILGTFYCGVANDYFHLMAGRIIAGAFGGMLNSIVLAIVSDIIPFQRRGNAMGIIMSSFSVASIIGVPLSLAIADATNWHNTFYFICLFSFVILAIMTWIIPNVDKHLAQNKTTPIETLKKFGSILKDKNYLLGHSYIFMIGFSAFILIPFISPFLVKNVGLLTTDLKLQYMVGGIFTIITANIIGKMTDKMGALKMFTLMAILSFVPILLLTHLGPSPLWIILVVSSLFMGIVSGRFIPCMTMVSQLPRENDRGSFMGLSVAIRSLSTALATYIAGIILTETADGKLEHYDTNGYIAIGLTMIAMFIAFKVSKTLKVHDEIN